ncbi:MAG: hypothetical protein Q8O88_02260 [bacterium]|nr:hypothetical protein [bacterium]
MNKYYLAVDNSTQWETVLIAVDDNNEDKISFFQHVDSGICGPFIHSICSRELHFGDKKFYNKTYYGWTLSEVEFNKIKRMIDLYPEYLEYLKLYNL